MAASIVQSIGGDNGNGVQAQSFSKQFTASLCVAGNTLVAFGTMSDFAGVHNDIIFIDSESNTYTLQNQANTNPSGGAGTLVSFTAPNIAGDTSVKNTGTLKFSNVGDIEDFLGLFLIEVSGVATTGTVVGHNGQAQDALAPGSNNVSSGNIVLSSAQVPCIIVAAAMNTSGNSSSGRTPTVGTGFTQINTAWNFTLGLGNLACFAYRRITVAGTYAATFNQPGTTNEDYACVAVALLETPPDTFMGQILT